MWRFAVLCLLVKFFRAQAFEYPRCEKTFVTKQFTIQSPYYPRSYGGSCEYFLKGQGCPTYYNFEFLDFDLEESLNCVAGRLEIGQQVLCGKRGGIESYFSEDGDLTLKFSGDYFGRSRGFNILITRQSCLSNVNETKLDLRSSTESCCQNIYDQRKFVITNPGFPRTESTSADCEYKIKRVNDRVCRLRLIFKYYWNGAQENDGCSNGYLEIDGKKICGCKSGLKLIANFDRTWGNKLKVIKYKNDGGSRENNGFFIEIFQDECPRKHETHERNNQKHWYRYEKYGLFDFIENTQREDVDETTYVDISNYNPSFPKSDYTCENFRSILLKEILSENIPKCHIKTNENKCIILDSVRGRLQSDGYPFIYQNNLNQCYRFIQQPGYCSVKLCMEDFDLQYSHHCKKDYLQFENNNRYCGNSLCRKMVTFEFNKRHMDLNFVTDYCYRRRGFSGRYEQQLCDNTTATTEETTVSTEITTKTPITTTIESLPEACGGVVMNQQFNIEVYGSQESTCRFLVSKLNESVCTLHITFVEFDLNCNVEYLLINGRNYCGNLSGETMSIDFDKDQIELVYQRKASLGLERRFLLQLEQDYTNCSPDLEPSPDK